MRKLEHIGRYVTPGTTAESHRETLRVLSVVRFWSGAIGGELLHCDVVCELTRKEPRRYRRQRQRETFIARRVSTSLGEFMNWRGLREEWAP